MIYGKLPPKISRILPGSQRQRSRPVPVVWPKKAMPSFFGVAACEQDDVGLQSRYTEHRMACTQAVVPRELRSGTAACVCFVRKNSDNRQYGNLRP